MTRRTFETKELERSRRLRRYEKEWDTAGSRATARTVSNPYLMRLMLNDPSHYLQVDRIEGMAPWLLDQFASRAKRGMRDRAGRAQYEGTFDCFSLSDISE